MFCYQNWHEIYRKYWNDDNGVSSTGQTRHRQCTIIVKYPHNLQIRVPMHCFQEFRPVVALLYIHRTQISDTNTVQLFLLWRCDPTRVMASSFLRFLDHTQLRTTVVRTPLDEWSARRRDLYLTIHNTHNREKSIPPVGFEPTISAGERPQTYVLDRAATGTGKHSTATNR
jgi:hypothetical protein